MQVYFIKSTYNGNTYKVSDFYTGTEYKTIMTKMLDLNFKPTDGVISIMTRQITLPDDTSVRDYTHMIVPEVEKIYEIINIDQQNSEQYRINLVEDAFIGNYNLFNNEEMIVTRTNEYKEEWYQGVTDITDMSYDFTYQTTDVLLEQNRSGSDIWAAVYIQAPDEELYDKIDDVRYNISTNPGRLQAETFSNITTLRNKYENFLNYSSNQSITLNKFFSLDYKYKIAYVKNVNKYYYYAIWFDGLNARYNMDWVELGDRDFFALEKSFLNRTVNNNPDLSTIIMLIPNYEGIALIPNGGTNLNLFVPSMSRFSGLTYTLNDSTKVAANILGVRLIPESLLKTEGQFIVNSQGLDISGLNSFTNIQIKSSDPEIVRFQGLTLNSLKEEIDISLNGINDSVWNKEPFKTYELWIFGQKYDIPAYFVNNLHMVLSSTSDGIQYNVYRDAERRKLYLSGNTSWEMKYKADQLELYAMNNPTYKDEFNNKMQQKWARAFANAGAGIAAGAISDGMGGAVSAVSGIVSTGVQTHFDRKQFDIMQANKRMQPDQIYGNSAGAAMVTKIHNGIYWVTKTGNNQSQMINEYERKGYPTFITGKPTDMNWITNSLYDGQSTKIIFGYFLKTIKNNYVTNEVNKKLTSGVTLIL